MPRLPSYLVLLHPGFPLLESINMTGPISAPRYSAEDFETASIRSTAPSYRESGQMKSIIATALPGGTVSIGTDDTN